MAHPERVTAIVSQNGNAYEEGLGDAWAPIRRYWSDPSAENRNAIRGALTAEGMRHEYSVGMPNSDVVAPESYTLDAALLARPGNVDIQLDLFLDYANNVKLYPKFQEYFRLRSRRCSRFGERKICTSFRRAPKRFGAIFRMRRCNSWTPATLRWKHIWKKSLTAMRAFLAANVGPKPNRRRVSQAGRQRVLSVTRRSLRVSMRTLSLDPLDIPAAAEFLHRIERQIL